MGDVKDAIKGPKKVSPKLTEGNLVQQVTALVETVGELIQKKDDDTSTEGKDKEAENIRKAGQLRAVSSLLRSGLRILEDY